MSEHEIELIVVLMLAVVALATLAARLRIPYPMLLLAGGMTLALIPGLPRIELDPDLVFVLFLPPILFYAAYFTSWRDFRGNIRPIGLLAIGGVLATMGVVAIVAKLLIPAMPWAAALTLGAIVSPPDAVAATAIFQRLGAPHRVVTILEGESLVNDASALIAYRFGVAAVVGGTFSLVDASLQFALLGVGGVAFGLLVGWIMIRLLPLAPEPSIGIAFTLLMPVATYVLAEQLHVSGVLAAVAAGIYFGRRSSGALTSRGRIAGRAVWDTVVLMINGIVFILIGLQLPHLYDDSHQLDMRTLIWQSLAISLAVIVARFLWVIPATYLPRFIIPGLRARDPLPHWKYIFIIAWSGLRGVVSLASALSLPLVIDSGAPFPYRNDILFITFGVIMVTLLGQGALIPLLIRVMGVDDDGLVEREVRRGRLVAAEAAIAHLDRLEGQPWVPSDHLAVLRYRYMHAREHLNVDDPAPDADHLLGTERLRDEVINAARQALIEARDFGVIGDDARNRIEADLDFEQLATEI